MEPHTDRVVTFAELRETGLSRRAVAALVDTGTLVSLRRGVYAASTTCADARDAALHGGGLACVSAARHAGLWVLAPDDAVHVGLGGNGHRRPHDGCRCVEHWDDAQAGRPFGVVPVAGILRQIFLCRGIEEFFVGLESALHQRKITASGLAWLRARCGDAVREAIGFARRDAESGLESLLRWRLRRLGVPLATQVSIPSVGRVDFLLGDVLIVEVDGKDNHDDETHRHKDLVRDANAAAWGYITLRFDYALIVHDWPTVEAAIRTYVERGLHLRRS